MKTLHYQFPSGAGHLLAASLDLPSLREPVSYALFSHCFTCSKELTSVRNIAAALTENGIGVFRFDFSGLGKSEGCFSDTTFSTNVDELYRASKFMEEIAKGPRILIGHSLGGAAAIRAAGLIASVKGVATIGAPADPVHVTHLLNLKRKQIEETGSATVSIAKRDFLIKKAFIDDLESISMEDATHELNKDLLVLHSPVDEIVGIDNAAKIYQRARHPKSFISLANADHLLTQEKDSRYVANMIAAWASRFIEPSQPVSTLDEVIIRIGEKGFRTDILVNGHELVGDEPVTVGGTDLGPTPYDFLSAGLGACTAMTLRMYATRKSWPLEAVQIRLNHQKIHATDCNDCETSNGKVDLITREVELTGDLDDEQRARLLEIADRCPVHRSLESGIKVQTTLKLNIDRR